LAGRAVLELFGVQLIDGSCSFTFVGMFQAVVE
jgi:hypothetical protein